MKVVVLGKTGMLGSMLSNYLSCADHDVVGLSREDGFVVDPYNDNVKMILQTIPHDADYIVNCIGAIKPMFSKSPLETCIYTNAVFPHLLQSFCHKEYLNSKLIHITTDCVFDGKHGCYLEDSPHNACDDYGRSKSLGEPKEAMVIRTSIIGPEVKNKRSLLEWFLNQKRGATVFGFSNHYWNGLTTVELSRCIGDIIDCKIWCPGVAHIHSDSVDKYTMLKVFSEAFRPDVKVEKRQTARCDRTLLSLRTINRILKPKSFSEMIEDLKIYV